MGVRVLVGTHRQAWRHCQKQFAVKPHIQTIIAAPVAVTDSVPAVRALLGGLQAALHAEYHAWCSHKGGTNPDGSHCCDRTLPCCQPASVPQRCLESLSSRWILRGGGGTTAQRWVGEEPLEGWQLMRSCHRALNCGHSSPAQLTVAVAAAKA